MTDAADKLKDSIADGTAEADEIAEDNEQSHTELLQALIASPEGRDPALWESAYEALVEPFGIISFEEWVTFTTVDYVEMDPSPYKVPVWSAMVAAAQAQADTTVLTDVITAADKHAPAQNKAAAAVGKAGLQTVAKEGVSKDRFTAAKDKRKAARDETARD
ncbi:MAG: hypothetical protein GY832_23780 [Chloroflexi bacterium]|nr:hypothetical protein [Chloroflexota bacterium]